MFMTALLCSRRRSPWCLHHQASLLPPLGSRTSKLLAWTMPAILQQEASSTQVMLVLMPQNFV